MDQIETICPTIAEEVQGVPEVELKRVRGLRLVITSDNVEPCPVVSHRSTTGTAEQVKDSHWVGGLVPSGVGRPDLLALAAS